jgi:Ca-activated chloride channel family protein
VQRAIGIGTTVHRMMVRGLVCILLCSCAAICQQIADTVALASRPESTTAVSTGAEPSAANIRVTSELVVVPVTVTDSKGQIVNGLQKEHFTLYEDKVQQPIAQFAAEDAPVSIGLVFDASDSMGPKLQKAREAVAAVLNSANPEDEFFLVQFNQHPRVVVGMTSEREEIRSRASSIRAGGSTALLDAVTIALSEMKNASHSRKAIIIISDGEDNASHCSVQELKETVRQADVLIYAIGITDSPVYYSQAWPPPKPTGSALLNEITKQTGGRLFEVHKVNELPSIASKISAWLRNQYVLAYTPNSLEKNGQYHRIQVRIEKPKVFPRLHASWRLGYYSPAE